MTSIFTLFFVFLFPNIGETLLNYQPHENVILNEVFIEIYVYRNFVWFSLILVFLFDKYNYDLKISLIIFLFAIIKYYFTIKKWKYIFNCYIN